MDGSQSADRGNFACVLRTVLEELPPIASLQNANEPRCGAGLRGFELLEET